MTKADRTCVKVALLPVLIFVVALIGCMIFRMVGGASPLPKGATLYILSASLIVTFGAIISANLLRISTSR